MAIIVEDGTLIVDANSLNSVDELIAYVMDRGYNISTDPHLLAPHLVIATDYLWLLNGAFKGALVSLAQGVPWPRSGVILEDQTEIADNEIPLAVKKAHLELAAQSALGVTLIPVNPGGQVLIAKKIGPIEKKWTEGTATVFIPLAERYLQAYLRNISMLTVLRV